MEQSQNIDSKVMSVFEDICNLSVVQMYELSEVFKKRFNLPEMSAMSMGGVNGNSAQQMAGNKEEEKTSFEVVLKSAGSNKVAVIKVIKDLLGGSLMDAKKIAETPNASLKKDISQKEANDIKTAIEEAGGSVELK